IAARYVAAGLHGRKTGRGYYTYPAERPGPGQGPGHRPEDPSPPEATVPGSGEGVIVIEGGSLVAEELRHAAAQAGYEVRSPHDPTGGVLPALVIECERAPLQTANAAPSAAEQPQGGAHLILCERGSLSALDPGGSAVGFHALAPLEQGMLVELTRTDGSSPVAAARAERFFHTLGKHVAWVGDAPGLVLGRMICQVINECAFALGEGVGDAQDIDTGMVLGLSYPRGPLEWADTIGLDRVLTMLGALQSEYGEERYRAAPALRALVQAGKLGRMTGVGFFDYTVET
ncbi:MAG TPA: 3-hydroxyacyl-CoA dehydrogenase family protein, partial [Solirubrobacteraceae bacterium]|nr:3-hydroxyacyl-CoA dehydrogenase family protein [Solirubrobacteraceae bacterium]